MQSVQISKNFGNILEQIPKKAPNQRKNPQTMQLLRSNIKLMNEKIEKQKMKEM